LPLRLELLPPQFLQVGQAPTFNVYISKPEPRQLPTDASEPRDLDGRGNLAFARELDGGFPGLGSVRHGGQTA
jgi:hypothetical protein